MCGTRCCPGWVVHPKTKKCTKREWLKFHEIKSQSELIRPPDYFSVAPKFFHFSLASWRHFPITIASLASFIMATHNPVEMLVVPLLNISVPIFVIMQRHKVFKWASLITVVHDLFPTTFLQSWQFSIIYVLAGSLPNSSNVIVFFTRPRLIIRSKRAQFFGFVGNLI